MFGEVAFDVCVDGCAAECKERHLSGFQVFVLPVELVGDEEGKRGGGEGERVVVGSFDCFSIEGEEMAEWGGVYLWVGCFLLGLGTTDASL